METSKIIDQKALKSILQNHPSVLAAYLIGSVAEKRERNDSDLDIVLLVDKNFDPHSFGSLYQKINQLIRHPNLDLRIANLQNTDPLFLFQLLKGELLFTRDQAEQIQLETRIMKLYYDNQHLRDIFHHYLNQRLKEGTYGQ